MHRWLSEFAFEPLSHRFSRCSRQAIGLHSDGAWIQFGSPQP